MQLGVIIDKAEQVGLSVLAGILEKARLEAEMQAASERKSPPLPALRD